MTRLILLVTAFTTIFLSGCASQFTTAPFISLAKPDTAANIEKQHSLLIGTWFGEAPIKEGGYRQWITYLYADGTEKTIFRTYDKDGDYDEQIEVGEWGISGNIHFTIMKGWIIANKLEPVDSTDPYYYDAYTITNLTQTTFEYEAVEYKEKFIAKKVKDDFQFPEK